MHLLRHITILAKVLVITGHFLERAVVRFINLCLPCALYF